ncbi:MAG TPA: MFS transporter [Longimicrobiales bacterium]|nr:MFS transporter [Longimicrobiales bacterium]
MDKRQVGAWALFDFANSVYPAVMTTAVFPVFYVSYVVGDEGGVGEWWWGRAVGLSALLVALSAPLLGAIADRGGARKRFMLTYTVTCVAAVALMAGLEAGMVVQGFVLFVVANVCFESALVFYNAYLPDIVPLEKQGAVSGLGFGVGYLGSAIGLMIALPFAQSRIEVVWPLVAIFFLVFSLPAFIFLPSDRGSGEGIAAAARWGLGNFTTIVREVWQLRDLRRFLIAFFFYIDGILTIIAFAGVVATETFGFDQRGTIVLFLIVQLSALVGAFALARPTDRFGPKRVLNGVIALWITVGVIAYFLRDPRLFYGMAVVAGLGLGSAQAASRAFMASLVPEGRGSEMFGFYALCGKSSSIVGPQLFGWTTLVAGGNQRPAFLVLTALFVVGLVLLQRVPDPKAKVA